ncbi:hypothetical protein T492DRAFT_1063654 [Pavlovales sp. CCMP2436]|nr:hypothetical protein T492DRAFT_1063654 [Pavlovales sp. CCMP2436]
MAVSVWDGRAKNIIAVVLVVGVVAISLATRGPQVHGHICFFDDETCARAERSAKGSADSDAPAPAVAEDTGPPDVPMCRMPDIMKLMACKGGTFNAQCCRGYEHFYNHNCVCSYDAWPRQYVGDAMTAMHWVRNIMKCNMSYAEVATVSPCIQQPSTCPASASGGVRLSSHPRGILLMFRDGVWGRVAGPGLTAEHASNTCRRLGYAAASDWADDAETARLFEHELPTDADMVNGTNQSLSLMRTGLPDAVHRLDCSGLALRAACPLNVPAPIPRAVESASVTASSPSPAPAARGRLVVPVRAPIPAQRRVWRSPAPVPAAEAQAAWVLGCTNTLASGELSAGPQSCWLGRDRSMACGGDGAIASIACGSVAKGR